MPGFSGRLNTTPSLRCQQCEYPLQCCAEAPRDAIPQSSLDRTQSRLAQPINERGECIVDRHLRAPKRLCVQLGELLPVLPCYNLIENEICPGYEDRERDGKNS